MTTTKTLEELKKLFQIRMQLRTSANKRLQTIREEKLTSLKELREIGKNLGVKGAHSSTTKTLCEKLNIPLVKNEVFEKHHRNTIRTPVKITFTSVDGEKIEFPSIYKAGLCLNRNPSCIPFYIKNQKEVMYEGKHWTISR